MAGFLGFGNYAKEGPGVSKNEPKKKTFIVFLETYFRNFWKFISISAVYFLMSVLLIPSGLAAAGITHVTRTIARNKHSFGLSDFFETIKKNWKQALVVGIINLLIYALIIVNLIFSWTGEGEGLFPIIYQGVSTAVAFMFSVMNFYIWTLLITFKFKTSQIYKNSFKFIFINLKMNFLLAAILVACYFAGYGLLLLAANHIIFFMLLVFLSICCFPAFRFLLIQFCTFPSIKKCIIDPYYKEHPHEDIELRRNLGLEIEEEKENAHTEPEVFDDYLTEEGEE